MASVTGPADTHGLRYWSLLKSLPGLEGWTEGDRAACASPTMLSHLLSIKLYRRLESLIVTSPRSADATGVLIHLLMSRGSLEAARGNSQDCSPPLLPSPEIVFTPWRQ